ncbi:MAG: hypothetical protein HY544_01060 [Candidatus Diapherotrites archaeon]|uniref:Class III signal peptide-containing protein n=1 Tax=Candidatus Iainarchaeum sp. TaxID=3101447 RepID=A0A8T3YMF6_9ARCH|nr:hypothetical protein [Candidatus Diapherotrites archaeon]
MGAGLRGQASLEYLVITAFLLLSAGIFSIYAFGYFGDTKNAALGQGAVSKIASSSNLAASLGNGSVIYFDVQFPDNAESLTVFNDYVGLSFVSSTGVGTSYAYSRASLTPVTIPVSAGRRTMSASFTDGNVVIR